MIPTAEELIEVRTIDGLTIAPDGRRVAYRVVSPSLSADRSREQWYSTDIMHPSEPIAMGKSSEPTRAPLFDSVEDGRAVWTSDAVALVARRLRNGEVQLYRLEPRGREHALTREAADIAAFEAEEGRLTFHMYADRSEIDRLQAEERQRGIRLDRSVSAEGLPLTGNFRIGERATTLRYVGLSTAGEAHRGERRSGTLKLPVAPDAATKARPLRPSIEADRMRALSAPDLGLSVRLAEIEPARPFFQQPLLQIEAVTQDGVARRCEEAFCKDRPWMLRQVSLDAETGEVAIFHEADFSGRTFVHGWKPRTGASRLIFDAEGSLDGGSASGGAPPCPQAGHYLVCVQAGPVNPPRLVRLDMRTGKILELATPNAVLAAKTFARSEFLRWTDDAGRPVNGVLLRPQGQSGRLPLVITTYRCRGFLNGGTSLLAPEHLLVARGFATLCINHDNRLGSEPQAQEPKIPLVAHKGAVASYESAIDLLDRKGLIDRQRVGVAGHSFSSMAIAYAISQTDLFQAAVIGTGTMIDPASYLFTEFTPDSWRKGMLDFLSLPKPRTTVDPNWRDVSPALNASRICTPLLVQSPESEYLLALQLFATMRDADRTVDMHIFPEEGHSVSRSPVRQMWRRQRTIEWFDFWLGNSGSQSAFLDREHWAGLKEKRKDWTYADCATGRKPG